MKSLRFSAVTALTAAALVLPMACSDSGSTAPSLKDKGMVVVKLTDAPFPTDEVKSVDVFVVRVDARVAATDDQGKYTIALGRGKFTVTVQADGYATTQSNVDASELMRVVVDEIGNAADTLSEIEINPPLERKKGAYKISRLDIVRISGYYDLARESDSLESYGEGENEEFG